MATIEAQLELEQELLDRTKQRYDNNVAKAAEQGRGNEVDSSRRLYRLFIEDITEALELYLEHYKGKAGLRGKYLGLIRRVDSSFACSVALNEMFSGAFDADRSIQNTMVNIGRRIEDEIKFSKFKAEHPTYFDTVIQDFKTKGTTNYRHMHRVLTMKMHEFDVEWNDWGNVERSKVGDLLFHVVMEATDLFEIKKSVKRGKGSDTTRLKFAEGTEEWIKRFNEHAQFLKPIGAPCIVPPKPWEDLFHGGFYSPELQSRFPFVRSGNIKHVKGADLSKHMQAVNRLQETAWQINPQVNHFFKWALQTNCTHLLGLPSSQPLTFPDSPVPGHLKKEEMTTEQQELLKSWKRDTARLHTKERKRYSESLGIWRITAMADEYKEYDKFYFVYTTDFRGRIYPVTAGLSPQGADYSKGLLRFSEGKELGKEGAYWFKVHGANLLGYDKDTYDGRVKYIEDPERIDGIKRVAADPYSIETAKFIGMADKPLQFLAWCLEFAEYLEVGDSFKSHLPVGLDGSCNGLQNFSALLLDSVGGLATNVLPSDSPNDIYGEVAKVAVQKLFERSADGCVTSGKLLDLGINRKTTKRSVMTLPYGLTKRSSGGYIGDWLYDNHMHTFSGYTEFNDARNVLNDVVWESIGEVVTAAREGMDWIQRVARLVGKANKALEWTTPTGFRVYQKEMKSKLVRCSSALNGVRTYGLREYTNKVDTIGLVNGSSPNFVHSLDAAHLVLTVLESKGITAWQMIHDDYGTYAADIPELHRAIRQAFVNMYDGTDLLQKFKLEIENILDEEVEMTPDSGDMDISQVLDAAYFFG